MPFHKPIIEKVRKFFATTPRTGGGGGRTEKQMRQVDTPLSAAGQKSSVKRTGEAPPLSPTSGLRPFQRKPNRRA